MKKIFAFILALVLAGTCALPAGAVQADEPLANDRCGDDLTWSYSQEDKVYHIVGTGDMWDFHCDDGDGLPAHPWGQGGFKPTMSFVIEPGVTSIGSGAFWNDRISSVTIADTVTTIGDLAFGNVISLEELTIPAGVVTISPTAFRECRVKTFHVDEANPVYTADEYGVLFSKDMTTLIQYPCGREGDYTIPASVTTVADGAFYGSKLTTVHIPVGVTQIGPEAFSNCASLEAITVDDRSPAYTAVDGVLFTKDMTTLVQHPNGREDAYTVPAGVTAIGAGAFEWSKLSAVTLPDGLTEIGDHAFDHCLYLKKADIPAGVTAIGDCAFDGCYRLEGTVMPTSLRTLGDRAFRSCRLTNVTLGPALESVGREALLCGAQPEIHIPASLTSLGERAFSAEKITVAPENPAYTADEAGVLYTKDMTRLIQAPTGLAGRCTIPAGVTRVDAYAFYGLAKLTHVTIPDTVTSLGECAFASSGLEAVILPEGITELPLYCFKSCDVLAAVTLPRSLKTIGDSAFYGTGLTELTLPDSVTAIGDDAFYGCEKLKTVTFGKNLAQLGQYAFGFCDKLTRAVFTGDAPEAVYRPFYEAAPGFAVYYTEGTQGWEPVMWNKLDSGCRAVPLGKFRDFADVPADKYYYTSVTWAVETGIAGGKDEAHFDPDGTCTRAQAVTFLWRAKGSPVVEGKQPFLDVAEDAYYRQAVIWAVEQGITAGVDETHFAPNAPVTRAQFVTFLYRLAGEPTVYGLPSFQDVDRNAYYFHAVRWAESQQIVSGTSQTTFSPNARCTRAQTVTFLLRRYGGNPQIGLSQSED